MRLVEVWVTLGSDPGPKLLERAQWPRRMQERDIPERAGDRVTQLSDGAAEQLAGGLELGSQAKEAELVVAGDVHSRAELIQEQEEPFTRLARHRLEPGLDPRRGGLLHGGNYPRAQCSATMTPMPSLEIRWTRTAGSEARNVGP